MTTIPYLQPGDLIYITAPAKAIEHEHVFFAKDLLEKKGFKVKISVHCLGQFNYFSGTDEERTADFQAGMDDPEVKAILCARGGYGCVRIVDQLNWAGMLRQPKWIIGFSDITVFHHRMQKFNLPSIHGSVVLNFKDNSQEALTTMVDALTGTLTEITATPHTNNQFGNATGKLIGGNLSIVYSLLGTNDALDFTDSILFIEDLAEHLYHIDRMIFALEKAGALSKIKGLIVGGMTDLEDTTIPFGSSIEEIILRPFEYRKIPIAFDFPAGHINDNRALVLGANYQLDVSENGTVLTKMKA
jgi:muramoyltetrapeptide carboxypeptidase